MSSWISRKQDYTSDGIPHLTKIIRKPKGVGTEMKCLADGVVGIMLQPEICEDKEAESQKKWFQLPAGSTNSIFQNISSLSYSNSIDCSFLNNQSFYCVVCCSSDQSVPPDSSVYNLSNTKGTEVTVSLQGLTIGQMYYCKAAATNTNSTRCAGPVVGGVKMYFSFLASLPSTTFPTTLTIPLMNIQAVSVLNPDNTLRQLEISWIPVADNVTTYTVRVVGADGSVGQGCTVCTTSPCLYVYQVTHVAVYYNISVTSINPDGTLGSQNSTTFSSTNSIFQNISSLSYSKSIDCSFFNNQSFYCGVCCSLNQSVPPDSSVYNVSNTKGTEVTVSLQGLTSGQIYYCMVAATNTNSTRCAGPVVGGVKMYFSFLASLPSTTFPTTCPASIPTLPSPAVLVAFLPSHLDPIQLGRTNLKRLNPLTEGSSGMQYLYGTVTGTIAMVTIGTSAVISGRQNDADDERSVRDALFSGGAVAVAVEVEVAVVVAD
ncbi:hypothetical protein EMCRGX_G003632 [Ephydatia muelleri]